MFEIHFNAMQDFKYLMEHVKWAGCACGRACFERRYPIFRSVKHLKWGNILKSCWCFYRSINIMWIFWGWLIVFHEVWCFGKYYINVLKDMKGCYCPLQVYLQYEDVLEMVH